jgi:hypothetical protein
MCPPKVPSPPPPPAAPSVAFSDQQAEIERRRLAGRSGYAAAIRTSSQGAAGFGRNLQAPGLSSGTATTLGGTV